MRTNQSGRAALQNLLKDLENLLQQDQSLISDGAILKNAVIEAALNMEPRLLELLMQSDTIKAHFFTEVAGTLVFDKVKFQDFVSNKAFLPDSYTAFKNRIGLTDRRGDYLSQSRDVVLAWPYKDCVLEGARYAGKVKLIYIDPPYNTGNDGFRYNDRFNHSAWLTFMRNRLEVAKELLSRDGAIFVNLDDGEAHYCKVLMDEVFGRENFVANLIWQKKYAPQNDAKWFSDDHDHILCFARDRLNWFPNGIERNEAATARYKNPDDDPRGPWQSDNALRNEYREYAYFEIVTPSGRSVFPPEGTSWRFNEDEYPKLLEDNRLWFGASGKGVPRIKRFLSEVKGTITPQTLLMHKDVGHNQEAKREVAALGLPTADQTPKPERLLQRIIHIGSNEGDTVLDFFAGSGTTSATAHKMKRKWLAIEQMDYIQDFPFSRFQKVIEGEQGGISEAVEWQGGGSFIYAELAASNSAFADRIEAAPDMAMLQTVHADILATGYLRYDVDLNAFDTDDFAALPLDDAKRVLMDCLDTNHLYVNLGSLGDADFGISDEDAAATRSFYGITA
ncbi:unnamed protein product [Cyprideis torosa]|uniref:Uncharacterized protein n=1 Tax=Cyprideis torosa TaxID=163714 RepID=A0A7R8WGU7_9CRUS|nr:unnamed protein product [Cyprideis torosa]CAG0892487.1 unnamed protein product [Cyprideis torosa]